MSGVTFLNQSGGLEASITHSVDYLQARAVPDGALSIQAVVHEGRVGWSYAHRGWNGGWDDSLRTFRPLTVGDGPKFLCMFRGIQIYYTHPIDIYSDLSVIFLVESPIKAESLSAYLGVPCVAIYGCAMWRASKGVAVLHPDLIRLRAYNALAEWVVMFDGDVATNANVAREAAFLSSGLSLFSITHKFLKLPELELGSGADDWVVDCIAKGLPPEQALRQLGLQPVVAREPPSMAAAKCGLQTRTNENGALIIPKNFYNLCAALKNHEEWKGKLSTDEYLGPRYNEKAIDQTDLFGLATKWAESTIWYGDLIGVDRMAGAMQHELNSHKTNVLKTYLDDLNSPEVVGMTERFATECLGVEKDMQAEYIHLLRCFGVALMARIYKPGSKFDGILILQGHEGLGKTWMLERLLGTQFSTIQKGMKDIKDIYRSMRGSAVVIFDELVGFNKADMEELWSLASETEIKFIDKYQTYATEFLSHSVFVGTTAKTNWDYSRSGEGARRYMIIKCKGVERQDGAMRFSMAWLEANREALLAEWRDLYLKGLEYWKYEGIAKEIRASVRVENPHIERLKDILNGDAGRQFTRDVERKICYVISATQATIMLNFSNPTRTQVNDVASALREMGFESTRVYNSETQKKEDRYVIERSLL